MTHKPNQVVRIYSPAYLVPSVICPLRAQRNCAGLGGVCVLSVVTSELQKREPFGCLLCLKFAVSSSCVEVLIMNFPSRIKSGLLVLTAGACLGIGGLSTSAVAGVSEEPSIHSLSPAEVQSGALTVEQSTGGIRYVAGGIGVEERAWLATHAAQFNTHITFAVVPGGAFISDVHVGITNAKGASILDTTAQGPKLLVELPPGSYHLTATHDGQTIHRTFAASSQGHAVLDIGFKQ
jgi:hypothetical protein